MLQSESIHWQGLAELSIEAILRGPVRLTCAGSVPFQQEARYAYDARWLPGLDGAVSLVPVRMAAPARIRWQAEQPVAAVSYQDGFLRLRIDIASGRPVVETVAPDAPDELTAAILGVHPWHWLEAHSSGFAEPCVEALPRLWNEEGVERARGLWLSEVEAPAMARIRTASLDWVSMVCLQPGPAFSPTGFGADWFPQQLRRVCGAELRTAAGIAAGLRSRILERTSAALEAAVRARGSLECRFPCSSDGLAALRHALGSAALGERTAPIVIPLLLPASFENCVQAAIGCTADGQLIAHPGEGAHALLRTVLESGFASAVHGEDGLVSFEASAAMPARQAASFLASSGIGGELTGELAAESGDAAVRILYRLRASQLCSWMELPPERSVAYFPRVSTFSVNLQKALRRWLAAYLLADPARIEDLKQGPSYLLYRASQPHKPRTRASFSNDVLDHSHVRGLYRGAQPGLRQLLPPIEEQLRVAGLEPIARMYTARRIGRCLEPVRGELPRALASLLAAEGGLIEDLVRIATQLSAPVDGARRWAPMREIMREIPKAVQSALRRAARGQALEWLTPLICAEATLAMAAAAGRGESCEVAVEAEAGRWRDFRGLPGRGSASGGTIQCLVRVADECDENVLEQSNDCGQQFGKTDDGGDRRRIRAEGECRFEAGFGVEPSGRPGERIPV